MAFLIVSQTQESMGSLSAEVIEFNNTGGSTGGTIKTGLRTIKVIQATLKDSAIGQIAATPGANAGEVDVVTAADKPGYVTVLGN